MNNIKNMILIVVMLFTTFMNIENACAAGENNAITVNYSIHSSKNTVNVGSTVDISIKISGATKKIASNDITLIYDATKFKYENYSVPTNVAIADREINASTGGKIIYTYYDTKVGANAITSDTIVTFTFKALDLTSNATGAFSFTVRGVADEDANMYTVATSSGSKNVTVHVPSTNNYLSSLTLSSGTLSPVFNKNTTKYVATVDAESVTITATPESSVATIEGTGTKTLKYGEQNFTIKVKSESGDIKAYVLTITRPDYRSTDNKLSSLTVTNTNIKFDGAQSYNCTVENNIDHVVVNAIANHSKSTIAGIGKHALKVGKNNIVIKVTAENGSIRQYTITVTRKDKEKVDEVKPKSSNNYLTKLIVQGANFFFDKNTLDYTMNVGFSQEKLVISYNQEDKTSLVKIIGGNNLSVGNNSVAVVVTAENGEVRTYNLTIIRDEGQTIVDNNIDSIKNAIPKFDNELLVKINSNESAVLLDTDTLKLLNDNNKILVFEWFNTDGSLSSSLTVNTTNVDLSKTLNPNILTTLDDQILKDYLSGYQYKALKISGNNIPNNSKYRLQVDSKNETYYLYYTVNGQIINKILTVQNGFIEFSVNDNMDYAILNEQVSQKNKNNTVSKNDWILPVALTVIIGIIFTIIAIVVIRKQKRHI